MERQLPTFGRRLMERLFTIGAYGWDAESFFGALHDAKVDQLLDIRRRRGIRGPLYTFGNATRLKQELESRGIAYRHILDLAPQPASRALQNRADEASGRPKRQRALLDDAFASDYAQRTLEPFDFDALARDLEGFKRPVLFCVERTPEACHRSLVAARLHEAMRLPVTHLVPISIAPVSDSSSIL